MASHIDAVPAVRDESGCKGAYSMTEPCTSIATPPDDHASRQHKETVLRFGKQLQLRIAHKARSFEIRYTHRRSGQVLSAMDHPFWLGSGIGELPGQRKLRRALLNALPAEIGIWVKRMRFTWLTHADIAELWKNMETVRRIAEDNIRLLPIWLLLASERRLGIRMPDAQPILAMKMQLQTLGVLPRTWRALCRYGVRLFPAVPGYELGNVFRRFERAVAYLRLAGLDDIAAFSRPEKWCAWWFANEAGGALWEFGPELPRAALHQLRKGVVHWDATELNELDYLIDFDGMADVVLSLAETELRKAFDNLPANKRGKRWSWWEELPERLTREIERYSRKEKSDDVLPVRIGAYSQGLYNIVPLSTEAELVEEGNRMDHCLRDGFRRHYDRKSTWLHSIRDSAVGTSIATIAIEADENGFPHISEAQAQGNEKLPLHVIPIILELLTRHCAAAGEVVLPRRRAHKGNASRPVLATGVHCLDEEVGGLNATEVTVLVGTRGELMPMAYTCMAHVLESAHRDVVFVTTHGMASDPPPIRTRTYATRARDSYEVLAQESMSRGLLSNRTGAAECFLVDSAQIQSMATLRRVVDEISEQASPALIVIEATSVTLDDLDSGRLENSAKFLGLPILVLCATDLQQQGPSGGKVKLLKRLRKRPGNFALIDQVAA